jgi:hypothetical protein
MKLARMITLAFALLVPTLAIAGDTASPSCCPGPCCPHCPHCPHAQAPAA